MIKASRIHRGFWMTCVLCVVGTMTGCSSALVGTWEASPIPQDMEFYILSAEFKDNGDYRAVARDTDGERKNLRGKYEFDGFKLKLMRPGASAREYPATYYMTGILEIKSDAGTQRLKKK